jgi:hypothetical protein
MKGARRSLQECIDQFISRELGIADTLCSKLHCLGIDLKQNTAEVFNGMYATAILVPQKKLVIKYCGNETSANIPKPHNVSRHILQPYCSSSILGNDLMIFPLLDTASNTAQDVAALHEGLNKEGYIFDDDKLANIGKFGENPYVIDSDAVWIDVKREQASDQTRPIQWDIIFPRFPTDHSIVDAEEPTLQTKNS